MFLISNIIVASLDERQIRGGILLAVVCAIALGLYLLPSIIAIFSAHPTAVGIIVLNVLLGWTVVGWVAAFVWSCIKSKPPMQVIQVAPHGPPPPLSYKPTPRFEDELDHLQRLRERKLLSDEEFEQKRNKILDQI
ncbi:MAG: superinfection immunity protein [Alphaproteobacteria bacterium]|nr:MAG: superinfection immunity protein [Alphaproteobacteria bacterium]